MKNLRTLCLIMGVLALSGCYAARIETGLTPGTKTIEKKWASCWLWGLVPPSTVNAAAACPHGVARVETQHSFLNGLVAAITEGIYTPIQIVVTCAEEPHSDLVKPAPEIQVGYNASTEDVQKAFGEAAKEAVKTGQPVYVRMTY